MGARGPAKTPKVITDLRGTTRKDRLAPNAPEMEAAVPGLPDGWGDSVPWGEEAVAEYWRLAGGLKNLGLLSREDRAALLLYCDAWGRWCYYRDRVAENGGEQVSVRGYRSLTPDAILMEKAETALKRYLALFGLSPSDRTKVSALSTDKPTQNPFTRFSK